MMNVRFNRRHALAMASSAPLAGAALNSNANAQDAASAERPGYLFVTGITIVPEVLAKYARTLPAIYEKFSGYYLASGGPGRGVTVLESDWSPRSVILAKFPAIDTVNAFWWSPEYRASAAMREGAGKFDVIRLKGRPGDLARPTGKPAYLIGIIEIRDPEKNAEYGKQALPLVLGAGGKVVAGGSRKDIELLEGEFGNKSVTIVQFPDLAALRGFYNSPAYQAIIPIRQASGESVVIEVDGVAYEG